MKLFDMKTQPWFIRINNEEEWDLAQQWLKENFGKACAATYSPCYSYFLTNKDDTGYIGDHPMHGRKESLAETKRYEIKLTYKTVIDSVIYPEVETEQQKKIKELKETIRKAQEQIDALEEK